MAHGASEVLSHNRRRTNGIQVKQAKCVVVILSEHTYLQPERFNFSFVQLERVLDRENDANLRISEFEFLT